jgi:hypothetical protein
MPLFFREHRGSFLESMKTIRKIENISELGNVTIEEYGYDKRLNSESKIVIKNGKPIGFITNIEHLED